MTRLAALSAFLVASCVAAQSGPWGQCGGTGWTGATTCVSGWTCVYSSESNRNMVHVVLAEPSPRPLVFVRSSFISCARSNSDRVAGNVCKGHLVELPLLAQALPLPARPRLRRRQARPPRPRSVHRALPPRRPRLPQRPTLVSANLAVRSEASEVDPILVAAGSPIPTLVGTWLWIRAVEAPNFHKYLRSYNSYAPGDAILGDYTMAAQFNVVSGQLEHYLPSGGESVIRW